MPADPKWDVAGIKAQKAFDALVAEMTPEEKAGLAKVQQWMRDHYDAGLKRPAKIIMGTFKPGFTGGE